MVWIQKTRRALPLLGFGRLVIFSFLSLLIGRLVGFHRGLSVSSKFEMFFFIWEAVSNFSALASEKTVGRLSGLFCWVAGLQYLALDKCEMFFREDCRSARWLSPASRLALHQARPNQWSCTIIILTISVVIVMINNPWIWLISNMRNTASGLFWFQFQDCSLTWELFKDLQGTTAKASKFDRSKKHIMEALQPKQEGQAGQERRRISSSFRCGIFISVHSGQPFS